MAKKVEITIPPGRLWPNAPSGAAMAVEVFGATGEYKSGKTLLGLSIAPGCHKEGKFQGKPRTLYLDFEKSGGTYGGVGCQRIDVPSELMGLHRGNYRPLNVFEWFAKRVDEVEPGQFDVIMADPVTDIESGLVEYVKKNSGQFGLTANQVDKSGGLLWGAVKDFWKTVLLKLSTRCQCFFFTAHLRDVWAGNSPTGKREPKGKETLMELASLYLWLERKAEKDGRVPDKPSALVLKQRLADTSIDLETGELRITPLMPPRIPVADVAAIRRYIAQPPDYSKLKDGERVVEQPTSEEELLRLKLATAEAERDTEQSRLQRLARMAELQGQQRQQASQAPQASDQTAATQQAKAASRISAAESARQQAEIDKLKEAAAGKLETAKEMERKILAETTAESGVAPVGIKEEAPATTATTTTAAPVEGNGNGNGRDPSKATHGQANEIERLFKALDIGAEKQTAILSKANAKAAADLSREHAHLLIEKLLKAEQQKVAAAKN